MGEDGVGCEHGLGWLLGVQRAEGAEGGGLFAVATSIASTGDKFGLTNGTTGNTSAKFGGGFVPDVVVDKCVRWCS